MVLLWIYWDPIISQAQIFSLTTLDIIQKLKISMFRDVALHNWQNLQIPQQHITSDSIGFLQMYVCCLLFASYLLRKQGGLHECQSEREDPFWTNRERNGEICCYSLLFYICFILSCLYFSRSQALPIFLRGLVNILQHQSLTHWRESTQEHYMTADLLLCIAIAGLIQV